MKKILFLFLSFYQNFLALFLKSITGNPSCKYPVSCSKYAYRAIEEKGVVRGLTASFKRIISCQSIFSI